MARKKRQSYRPSKKYICFIVEKCTEENYIKLFKLLYRQGVQVKKCNGGSAKKVLEAASRIIRRHGDEYLSYVLWFERDTYNPSQDANLLNSLKSKDNVEVYISSPPCIENWLLAHFQQINQNEPKCDRCLKILKQKYISKYEKNDCNMLTKFIAEPEINSAVANYPNLKGIPNIAANNRLFKAQQ